MDFKEERKLWDAINRLYVLEPEQRTISNFGSIVGELKERLYPTSGDGDAHAFREAMDKVVLWEPKNQEFTLKFANLLPIPN